PKVIISKREHQAFVWKTFEEILDLPLIWGEDEVFKRLHLDLHGFSAHNVATTPKKDFAK
ncbi:MAG: hypothetical protein K2Q34_01265, partial [Alphaproteobacteria bacterium]|nr:hypothetical protein [Alphaproteobacteria bacterium]